jgi:adenosylcobinamide amidohydrolase
MLRSVSDTADQDIPPAALAALGAGGGVDVWAVIEQLAADDAQLPALMRLAESSSLAFGALAQALADIGMNYGAADDAP